MRRSYEYINLSKEFDHKKYNQELHHVKYYDGKRIQKFYKYFDCSEIMVEDQDICDHDLRKNIKIIASLLIFFRVSF